MLKEAIDKIKNKFDIGEPPFEYRVLITLPEKEYPKYLAKMFYKNTGEKLNLKHPKTFNEKIQWLKLYDATRLKTKLTDKVRVRDWVKEKIGEEYLKPVLQICDTFKQIDFEKLPQSFIIKVNHACKWHFKIKDKMKLLMHPELGEYLNAKFNYWLGLSFYPFGGMEMQYKDILPKLIVEPVLIDEDKTYPMEYEIYCFNGEPKIFQKIEYKQPTVCYVYDEHFQDYDIKFNPGYIKESMPAEDNLKKAVELSKILAKDFKLVRVDWLIYNNQIYFNEMTFSPFSGFCIFQNPEWNERLGKMLKLD